MDQTAPEPTARAGRTLETEKSLVREAIAMIADGGSPRVTHAGSRVVRTMMVAHR